MVAPTPPSSDGHGEREQAGVAEALEPLLDEGAVGVVAGGVGGDLGADRRGPLEQVSIGVLLHGGGHAATVRAVRPPP